LTFSSECDLSLYAQGFKALQKKFNCVLNNKARAKKSTLALN